MMRFLVSLLLTGWLVFAGCSGDSSSLMSVYNDSGAGSSPGAGGTGGSSTNAQGGAGGQVSAGTIGVTGGIRDVATAQCISTSGGACPLSSADLSCLKGNCGASLTDCYSASGTSGGAAGRCLKYANCMLGCPCDAGKSNCENTCALNDVTAIPDCFSCLMNLGSCASAFGCQMTSPC
jgi:hypothetical protein